MFSPHAKILVVDDMMTMRKIILKTLRDIGFDNCIEAADGEKAWGLLNDGKEPVQLIISDWNMPNMNGLELLKKVKAEQKLSEIPFIVVTTESEADQVSTAIVNGAAGYVTKPFTSEILRRQLESIYKGLK